MLEILTVPEKKPVGRPPKLTAFGAWLKEHPTWTKAKIAKELGYSESHIQGLCNGNKIPNRPVALAIEYITQGEFTVGRWEKLSEDEGLSK